MPCPFAGSPSPLGPSKTADGINFAIFAKHASSVTLCLFDDGHKPLGSEIKLENKSGDVWHVLVNGLSGSGICYGYRIQGSGGWDTGFRWDTSRILLDPYAPLVSGRRVFGVRDTEREAFEHKKGSVWLGTFDFASEPFDWGDDDARTRLHLKDLVIYEMPVRSFTADQSSKVGEGERGSFLGVAAKADYLSGLGVNAVEVRTDDDTTQRALTQEPRHTASSSL